MKNPAAPWVSAKPKPSEEPIKSIFLNLEIAGLGREGCDVEVMAANPSCKFGVINLKREGDKLVRAKDMAEKLGARVVVLHPPFRWQRDYARDFGPGLERMSEDTDVVFAVENMYPLRGGGAEVAAYAPHWNPVLMDTPHVTLARLRDSSSRQVADYLAARGHYRSASFEVSRFVLFSSRSSVGGGPYVVVDMQGYWTPGPVTEHAARVAPVFEAPNGSGILFLAFLLERHGVAWGDWDAIIEELNANRAAATQLRLYRSADLAAS